MIRSTLKSIFVGLVLAFIYAPIFILMVFSFTKSTQIGAIRGFSMQNYVTLFTTPELVGMIVGTIALAVGSAIIATILGTAGAIGAFYSRKRTNSFISTMNQIPVVNADVVTGFSICILLIVLFHEGVLSGLISNCRKLFLGLFRHCHDLILKFLKLLVNRLVVAGRHDDEGRSCDDT